MANENKTQKKDNSVTDFINSIDDEQIISDCFDLVKIMSKISGHEPKMWGTSIIGFDKYHYKYDSGREGDAPIIAFSPRKGKITLYLDETDKYTDLLSKLGKHKTGKICVYIKQLSDIDLSVLNKPIEKSYSYSKSIYS